MNDGVLLSADNIAIRSESALRREQFVVLHRSNSKLRVDLIGQMTSNFCHAYSIAYFSFIVVGLPVKIARRSGGPTSQSPVSTVVGRSVGEIPTAASSLGMTAFWVWCVLLAWRIGCEVLWRLRRRANVGIGPYEVRLSAWHMEILRSGRVRCALSIRKPQAATAAKKTLPYNIGTTPTVGEGLDPP